MKSSVMKKTKLCYKCSKRKPLNEFNKNKSKKDGLCSECRDCSNKLSKKYNQEHKEEIAEYQGEYRQKHKEEKVEYNEKHYQKNREERIKKQRKYYEETGREKRGHLSMYKNKLCPNYLGIVIGERLVRHLFKDVEIMPYGNTGYDFICNKNKKIDVKIACITLQKGKYPQWVFGINYNITADFFILVAFDNLTDLNPLHIWMIPGKEINHQSNKSIRPSTLHKWDKWKRNTEEVQLCCTELKNK